MKILKNVLLRLLEKQLEKQLLSVTDEMGLSAPVKVNVKKPMSVLTTSIDELVIDGETQDIIIEDGSGSLNVVPMVELNVPYQKMERK